jgi:small subunit ribosomal protein S20
VANTKSAKKRIRQTVKRQANNRRYLAGARTYVKKTRALIEDGNVTEAEEAMKLAASTLDKAARKGVIHKGNAARRKGRIMAALAKLRTSKA